MRAIAFTVARTVIAGIIFLQMAAGTASGAPASAELWQARNGSSSEPLEFAAWVKGNAGSANSHYAEGHSIPYRMVLSGLSPGYHNLILEWDTKQNGKHAIDYLAHYNRLQPHTYFPGHTDAEIIDPLRELNGDFTAAQTFAIPRPSGAGSPVTNQPAASFNALPAAERMMSIWNGTITNITYVSEGDLSGETAVSQLSVDFMATGATVVIAWGGHIGTRLDWGEDRSAAGINGSPYHMRLVSLDGSGGNQDRSLQAQAIVLPPTCGVEGPLAVCPATTNLYSAITDGTNATYAWSLADNVAGAVLIGGTNGPSVQIGAGSHGSYTVVARVGAGTGDSTCEHQVIVHAPARMTGLADQIACPQTTVTFSTIPSGAGPFAFGWKKDGVLLNGATNSFITLEQVTSDDEGLYCVEVTGLCNSVSSCATLTVIPPPLIICPLDIRRECMADVPPADPATVLATSDMGPVTITHLGDTASTNGYEVIITRQYQAMDGCGSTTVCNQLITVRDTIAPIMACAPDRVVECGPAWEFDVPSANDACAGNLPVTVVGTTTNQLLGSLFSATRTWQAIDACGNVSTCSQTITLQDTTPPQIVCSSNITVVGAAQPGIQAVFTVTATDTCDTNVAPACLPPSGTVFPLGTTTVNCRGVDFSSNSAECNFTVTVQDLQPPQIICPANMVVAEDSPGIGHAAAAYPTPAVSDNFDANPVITCTPPPGAALPVGDNVVNCTAQDGSGNTAACSFNIRVVPHTIVAGSTADSGPGTLRQALLDANGVADANIIQFAFPGNPPHEIHLLSPLPAVTQSLTIDGWSQPGFDGSPMIEMHGAGGATGLVISAGNTTVRGLILNGFATGIHIQGSGSNVIQGNYIGTDSRGTSAVSNAGNGIEVASPGNLIGGATPQARNIVSANGGSGIVLETVNAASNTVQGNFVGVGSDGTTALGNGGEGVVLRGGAAHNMIGGNLIAYNAGAGIVLESSSGVGNAIRGNPIHSNGGLGIDVNGDGVTDNDDGDMDDGPNHAQNFPVLSKARTFGGSTTIEGTLNSASNAIYQIDFFVSSTAGLRVGEIFLGSATVSAGSNATVQFSITLPLAVTPDYFISATATDPANNTSEFSAPVRVGSPPYIVEQPAGTHVGLGTMAMFCVNAQGSGPLSYQWRRNGANIPDATNACYTIFNVKLSDGGSYSVVVANEFDAILSDEALLTFDLPAVPAGDNFAQRVRLVRTNGIAAGDNILATREAGEPEHADRPGGKSLWYSWIAPETGIAQFRTIGSTFDTLLAVYEGTELANLEPVSSDEDRGGFFTSDVRFNAYAGLEYHIAIDGYGGEEGVFVFDWRLEITGHLLPVIVTHPLSQTVAPGASCSFSVLAVAGCTDGHYACRHPKRDDEPGHPEHNARLTYQWFFNGTPIAGATNTMLTISGVQEAALGDYSVQVRDRDRIIESKAATLQINLSGAIAQNVQAVDKFLDALNSGPLSIGELPEVAESRPPDTGEAGLARASVAASGTVVSGFTGTQVFNTGTNTTSRLENICGVIGGASAWLSIVPNTNGILFVNTHGSTYDTVIALFTRSPTNALVLQLLDCNNNDGTNQASAVAVPVTAGRTNFVLIDGVGGARGILKLNYSLVTPSTLVPLGVSEEGANRFQVVGRPGMRFTIQRCSNLSDWSPVLTTISETAVFEFTDTDATPPGGTFYRALMLP